MTKVTYLDNNGFMVKAGEALLVFDYYRDPAKRVAKELKALSDSKIIFLTSGPEEGRFSKDIFNLGQSHERAYLMANAVISRVGDTEENIGGLGAGDRIEDVLGTGINVEAYGSTDKGVSFMVTLADGKKIFYGGALAEGKGDEFKTIVNRIAEENAEVYLAFLAVDAEAGGDYAAGARYFTETIKTDNFVPTDCRGKNEKAGDFRTYGMPEGVATKFHAFTREGQEIRI